MLDSGIQGINFNDFNKNEIRNQLGIEEFEEEEMKSNDGDKSWMKDVEKDFDNSQNEIQNSSMPVSNIKKKEVELDMQSQSKQSELLVIGFDNIPTKKNPLDTHKRSIPNIEEPVVTDRLKVGRKKTMTLLSPKIMDS